ncbi:MAG: N-acetylmuramoyl-L-alanine amidase [Elusimicrobia bacterium]|nr:N-acetylmuramoyl-L-alanine amidase [Elusimicrobiota bacterium]
MRPSAARLGATLAAALLSADAGAQTPPPPVQVSTAAAVSASTPQVTAVWPRERENFAFMQRTFTFGNVTAGSTLTINGVPAKVDADGAFFEMVALSSGPFAIQYDGVWQGVAVSTRRVVNVGPPGGLPDLGTAEAAALEPAVNREVTPGQIVNVRCRGPVGVAGSFSIGGVARNLTLVESTGAVRGVFSGFYVIQPADAGKDMPVECRWKTGFFSSAHAEAKGKISIAEPGRSRVAVTSPKWSVIKSQSSGYTIFLPEGVKLEASGRDGNQVRVLLAEDFDGWIDAAAVKFLPEGTPPPRATLGQNVSTVVTSDTVKVVFEISDRVAFDVSQTADPVSYTIRFFGAAHRFDRIRFAKDDPVVREVRWKQERTRMVEVTIDTALSRGWGYNAYYDASGKFVFEIVRPPNVAKAKNPLAGRRIVVDPGHGPETSAVGPRGTAERDVNLAIALRLRDLLSAAGADPYMIRVSSEGPPLADRPLEAWKAKGELYVSIHNNALPAAADPFSAPRGFMLFYYHLPSRPLAEAMHRSYQAYLSELADEGLQWGDLSVCRTTTMPAILTETAYMIFPDQEKKLLDAGFQQRVAKLLFEGIRTFYEDYKALQASSADDRRAAREEPAAGRKP